MTPAVIIAILACVGAAIPGLLGLVLLWVTHNHVQQLDIRLNGRMDELIEAARIIARAEGRAEQKVIDESRPKQELIEAVKIIAREEGRAEQKAKQQTAEEIKSANPTSPILGP